MQGDLFLPSTGIHLEREEAISDQDGHGDRTKAHSIYLATIDRGRQFVMQFGRWGMSSGQPQFQQRDGRSGIMRDAKDLVVFEAAHRKDFHDIDNADARFIAACDPTTVLALFAEIERLENIVHPRVFVSAPEPDAATVDILRAIREVGDEAADDEASQ